MATIFIANPTLQHRELHVRVNKGQTRILNIRAGAQERFPDDLSGQALKNVLQQIEAAGGRPANDPGAIRSRFSLLYTVAEAEKPIDTDTIDEGAEQDREVRQQLSGEILERSGVAAFNESAKVGGREMTMEITQVTDNEVVRGGVDASITVGNKLHPRDGYASSRKN